MTKQVRDLGFKGFTTAYNNWSSWQSDISRSQLPAIDMHAYHNLPSKFVEPGSVVLQRIPLPGAARFVRHLAGARVWGKPFTVTEYTGNPSGTDGDGAVGGTGAGLCGAPGMGSAAPSLLRTRRSLATRQTSFPGAARSIRLASGMQTVLRAGERLAALLYKRGDVATSKAHIAALLDPAQVLDAGNGLALNARLSVVALRVRVLTFECVSVTCREALRGAGFRWGPCLENGRGKLRHPVGHERHRRATRQITQISGPAAREQSPKLFAETYQWDTASCCSRRASGASASPLIARWSWSRQPRRPPPGR